MQSTPPSNMKVEAEILSTQTVKPSSPTPNHLRRYQLSFLDQFNAPSFMRFILFYPADNNISNSERSSQLKSSLSRALAMFYPLAGRPHLDEGYIDCNDEGVLYLEARVGGYTLSDVMKESFPASEINKFHPCDLVDVKDLNMVVQVNFFECGGIAVGIGMSHIVADGSSFCMFINTWAAISRGKTDIPSPKFEFATLFPPIDLSGFDLTSSSVKKEDNVVTKRFVFSASKIALLRDRYKDEANPDSSRRPTRVEALSSLFSTRFMHAIDQGKADPIKFYSLFIAANLRTRSNPRFPDYYFGNMSKCAMALVPNKEGYDTTVDKIREAVSDVNEEFIAKLKQGEEFLKSMKQFQKFKEGELVFVYFTSLCRYPIYEADFGWGRPAWAPFPPFDLNNYVVLMDTPSEDGIEVWLNLKGEDMAKLEADKEFLSFVSEPSC